MNATASNKVDNISKAISSQRGRDNQLEVETKQREGRRNEQGNSRPRKVDERTTTRKAREND